MTLQVGTKSRRIIKYTPDAELWARFLYSKPVCKL